MLPTSDVSFLLVQSICYQMVNIEIPINRPFQPEATFGSSSLMRWCVGHVKCKMDCLFVSYWTRDGMSARDSLQTLRTRRRLRSKQLNEMKVYVAITPLRFAHGTSAYCGLRLLRCHTCVIILIWFLIIGEWPTHAELAERRAHNTHTRSAVFNVRWVPRVVLAHLRTS